MRMLLLGFVLTCACTQTIPPPPSPAGSTLLAASGSAPPAHGAPTSAIDSLGPWPAICRHSRASESPAGSPAGASDVPVEGAAEQVSGRLPVELVQRPIRAHFACFKRCYELGLTKDPKLRGRVAVKIVIDGRSGAVRTSEDASSELADKDVVACVVAEFMAVTFPAPERDITVTYPIMFGPSADGTGSSG